jgi:K319-like protein
MRSKMLLTFLILTQVLWAGGAGAAVYPQPPADSPITFTGFIQAMTLDPAGISGDPLAGGTVTVNGSTIIIPRNTIVLMPGTFLSWQELWATAPAPWGLTNPNQSTGLALSDCSTALVSGACTGQRPLTTYEITILGNRIVDGGVDKYVAGLVSMSQQTFNLGTGIINYIDYAKGELHVGCPTLGSACPLGVGARVRINDPVGRYGIQQPVDPRFTADTDNPTIHARTGYPMCIPRTDPATQDDPACPQKNRPPDPASKTHPPAPLGNFTIGPPGTTVLANTPPPLVGVINALATAIQTGDSTQMAPFVVGDYIEYSGSLFQDPTLPGVAGQYIAAWNMVGNVGIYTPPGVDPAYVELEVTLLGVGGTPITAPIAVPQEQTTRIKVRGFFSDPTRTIDLYAIKVDPCSGAETEVPMLLGIQQTKGNIPWGRFTEVDQAGLFPVTREWMGRYSGTVGMSLPNGLLARQFRIPVATFITPENLIYGDPTLVTIPNNFQDFPFLRDGSGPWRGNQKNIVGQLSPFPLTNSIPGLTPQAPTGPTVSCTAPPSSPPVVVINPANQTVAQSSQVSLNATGSTDPQGQVLSFAWLQTSGSTVALSSANTPIATFTAPLVSVNTTLTFQVTVCDTSSLCSTGSTEVVVTPSSVAGDSVTITAVDYRAARGVLNVTATSSNASCSAVLTLQAFTSGTPTFGPVIMVSTGPAVGGCGYSYVSGRTAFPAPTSVTVKSSLGGTATAPPPPLRIR